MTDMYETALGLLVDVLEPEYPEAATFLKSEEAQENCCIYMQAAEYAGRCYSDAYDAAVDVLWGTQSDFLEAGDFLNSRIVRAAY